MTTPKAAEQAVNRTGLSEAIAVMAFAVAMFGVTFTFDKVPSSLSQGIPPTAFPRAMLILMFLLGALLAAKSLRVSPQAAAELKPLKAIPPIVFLTIGALIGFAILMPLVGTFVAMAIFLPGLALLWHERRWLFMGLSFAGYIAFAFGLFRLVMNVPLP